MKSVKIIDANSQKIKDHANFEGINSIAMCAADGITVFAVGLTSQSG